MGLSTNLSSPSYGNTVGTAVTLAIGGNGSKRAYFPHSAGTAHGAPPKGPESTLTLRKDQLSPVAIALRLQLRTLTHSSGVQLPTLGCESHTCLRMPTMGGNAMGREEACGC